MKVKFSTSGELLRNFVYLLFGSVGIRAISFVVTIIVARRIGVEAFGQLSIAQAVIGYFVLISDFGISLVAIREFTKTDKKTSDFAGEIIGTRMLLAALSTCLLLSFLVVFNLPDETRVLILLFSYSIPLAALNLEWFYRAIEDMGKVALTGVIYVIIPAFLLYLFVQTPSHIFLIPLFFAISGLIQIAIYWFLFVRNHGFPRITLQFSKIYFFLKLTSLLGLSNIMIQIYYNLDVVLLGFMESEETVGYYTAAYRLIIVFTTIAGIVGNSIFPRLSKLSTTSNKQDSQLKVMYLGARILIYGALPITILGMIYSDQIIQLVYSSEYVLSGSVLTIIIWQIFTVFANVAFAFNLLAGSHQFAYFLSVTAGAIINTVLNLILIPMYGMIGAAIATIVAEVIVLILLYVSASRLIAHVPIVGIVLRCFILGGIIAIIANSTNNLIIGSIISTGVYVILLILTRPFSPDEYQYFVLWRHYEPN